jgi:(p)ppGpp synthase/HD superfamily hydrolase
MKKGEMLSKMLVIATNAHEGQFDKAAVPYILHPLRVMSFLNTDDEELQCIAIGHDLFEDTSVTCEDLRKVGVSERVISGIMSMTKMPDESYAEYKVKVLANSDARKVKKCDLRHNTDMRRLKGVSEKDKARMIRYMEFYMEIEIAEHAAEKI